MGDVDERLAARLEVLRTILQSLESEICNCDLQLAEMESRQREILRLKSLAKERLRIAIMDIETVKAKINVHASKTTRGNSAMGGQAK